MAEIQEEDNALRKSKLLVEDRTVNVFSDEAIDSLFSEFVAVTGGEDGKLELKDFRRVLSKLLEETEEEKKALILTNELFLERMFNFLDTAREGKVTHAELAAGVGKMFSSEDEDMRQFRFSVYDVGNKGYFTPEDMFKVVHASVATELNLLPAAEDPATAEKMRSIALGDIGSKALRDMIGWAFDASSPATPGRLTYEEFAASFGANEELFDFRALSSDLLDELETELEGAAETE